MIIFLCMEKAVGGKEQMIDGTALCRVSTRLSFTQLLRRQLRPMWWRMLSVIEYSAFLIVFFFFFFFNFYLFIYLFLAVLGLRFCARAFSGCGKRGPLFITVHGPLTIAASLVVEHRLQTRRLSNCGSRAQLLRGLWDLPRPGLKPVSPALAGRFSTTAPPGKPSHSFNCLFQDEGW